MRASSEDDFYKAGWWNGIDDPEAGLKRGHAVAIDYRANGLDMTVFCTSITNKAPDRRLPSGYQRHLQ